MADSSSECRRSLRVPVRLEATVRMLLPEETFTPFPMRGVTRDISLSGLRFETQETSDEYYRLIIRRIRRCRIAATLPGGTGELTFPGRVVWVRFDAGLVPPVCVYGIAFEELGAAEREAVRACVELISQETAPGIAGGEFDVRIEEAAVEERRGTEEAG